MLGHCVCVLVQIPGHRRVFLFPWVPLAHCIKWVPGLVLGERRARTGCVSLTTNGTGGWDCPHLQWEAQPVSCYKAPGDWQTWCTWGSEKLCFFCVCVQVQTCTCMSEHVCTCVCMCEWACVTVYYNVPYNNYLTILCEHTNYQPVHIEYLFVYVIIIILYIKCVCIVYCVTVFTGQYWTKGIPVGVCTLGLFDHGLQDTDQTVYMQWSRSSCISCTMPVMTTWNLVHSQRPSAIVKTYAGGLISLTCLLQQVASLLSVLHSYNALKWWRH